MTSPAVHPKFTAPTGAESFPRGRRLRVALYSHDTLGLGHLRRNLAIATALNAQLPDPEILLISGVREARAFALPPNTDCLTLPGLYKDHTGRYAARSLSLSLEEIVELRAATIGGAVERFEPDLLVVDKVARGAFGELEFALETMRGRPEARVVLGLRDVLDDAVSSRREWHATATSEALEEFFDAVWVYGDPRVFDPVAEYRLGHQVERLARYTGYLARPVDDAHGEPAELPTDKPFFLCGVGGGQDGHEIVAAFLVADLPAGTAGVAVAGPFMSADARAELHVIAAQRPDRHVLDFVDDCIPYMRQALGVVSMGGYNTTVELLRHARRALIVPRVRPRTEQLLRAEHLARLGLVDLLEHGDLTVPALEQWMRSALRAPAHRPGSVDLDGLDRLPALVADLWEPSPAPSRVDLEEMSRVAV